MYPFIDIYNGNGNFKTRSTAQGVREFTIHSIWLLKHIGKYILRKKHNDELIMFNATFNNISAISWRSVLLVEETGIPEENHRPAASH